MAYDTIKLPKIREIYSLIRLSVDSYEELRPRSWCSTWVATWPRRWRRCPCTVASGCARPGRAFGSERGGGTIGYDVSL